MKLGCVWSEVTKQSPSSNPCQLSGLRKKGITAVRLREFLFSNASSQSTGTFLFL